MNKYLTLKKMGVNKKKRKCKEFVNSKCNLKVLI